MKWLDLYDAALIEQNKQEAATLNIEEYNYLINKAIDQYINLTYARFDLNQQASDDLRWLQRSVELDIHKSNKMIHPMEEANYICVLPADYLHILNCTVHFSAKCGDLQSESKCKPINDDGSGGIFSLCRRLTANQFPAIINNAYLRPTYKRPYFYINTSGEGGKLLAIAEVYKILHPCEDDCPTPYWKDEIYNATHPCNNKETSIPLEGRLMEIRCGRNKGFYPDVACVDYLKTPERITLTWEDVNGITENTKECEFPDAVAYEIINIFTKLLLENASDDRLQSHYAVNQTILGNAQPESK